MAKNAKYLQYAKSRSKVQQNIDLQQIALEYDKLLNKKILLSFQWRYKNRVSI